MSAILKLGVRRHDEIRNLGINHFSLSIPHDLGPLEPTLLPLGYTSRPLTVVVANPGNKTLNTTQITLQNEPTWGFGNTNF